MRGDFLYVIGEPGSGKSTLVQAMIGRTEAVPNDDGPFAFTMYGSRPPVIELGRRRKEFPGTDALAMNVQPKVQEWLGSMKASAVLAEGDRLANPKFFDYLIAEGWQLVIARIRIRHETAAARREARGSAQDETWLRSRRTKVDKLGAFYPERALNLWHEDGDTASAIEKLEQRSPVARAFRATR